MMQRAAEASARSSARRMRKRTASPLTGAFFRLSSRSLDVESEIPRGTTGRPIRSESPAIPGNRIQPKTALAVIHADFADDCHAGGRGGESHSAASLNPADLGSDVRAAQIARDVRMRNVSGAPAFFINGQRYTGAFDLESLARALTAEARVNDTPVDRVPIARPAAVAA
jgi:hypothetical protein